VLLTASSNRPPYIRDHHFADRIWNKATNSKIFSVSAKIYDSDAKRGLSKALAEILPEPYTSEHRLSEGTAAINTDQLFYEISRLDSTRF
jgi:hypothetical protein